MGAWVERPLTVSTHFSIWLTQTDTLQPIPIWLYRKKLEFRAVGIAIIRQHLKISNQLRSEY